MTWESGRPGVATPGLPVPLLPREFVDRGARDTTPDPWLWPVLTGHPSVASQLREGGQAPPLRVRGCGLKQKGPELSA